MLNFSVKESLEKEYKNVTMIAGGSGITPFLQLLRDMNDEQDQAPSRTLVYANKTIEDVWLKPELLALKNTKCQIEFLVEKAPKGWEGRTGLVTKDFLQRTIEPPAEDHLVFYCGPQGMNSHVKAILDQLGYSLGNTYQY